MHFKPRIFISSTLSENLKVRKEIESFFSMVGAEALLYEKNLTPSVTSMTYRKDILEADFVIFIIKDEYGTPTDTGMSGTHEEFRITLSSNIPKHVYIKLDSADKASKELIDEINNNGVSYYYFKNDDQLLSRIKETTFTIAKEIMLNKVENTQLPHNTVGKICGNHDYLQATDIIKIIKEMMWIHSNGEYDFVDSNIFDTFIEPITYEMKRKGWLFVNKELENKLNDMIKIYNEFGNTHCNDYTSIAKSHREFNVAILDKVIISRCSVDPYPTHTRDYYLDIVERFLSKFCELQDYVANMKISSDTQV